MAETSLTLKQQRFVAEYLVDHNGTQAAIRAGYSAKTAEQGAAQLLRNIKVKAEIESRTAKVAGRLGLSAERWAAEMACIGHFDPAELYDDLGSLIPIYQLPEHVRRAIASVEHITGKDGETTKKLKLWDKNTALANIGKHLGMFKEDNAQKAQPIQVMIQLLG